MAVVIADLDHDGSLDIVSGSGETRARSPSATARAGGRFSAPQPPAGRRRRALDRRRRRQRGRAAGHHLQRPAPVLGHPDLAEPGRAPVEARARAPTEINTYEGLRAADLNGDGHIDIVAANATSDLQGGIQVWWGTGSGSWVPGLSPTVTGIYMDVAAADFNGDGLLDLAGAGWGTHGGLRVWLGNGAGRLDGARPGLPRAISTRCSAADLDARRAAGPRGRVLQDRRAAVSAATAAAVSGRMRVKTRSGRRRRCGRRTGARGLRREASLLAGAAGGSRRRRLGRTSSPARSTTRGCTPG
ncbi:MAG: VCBS repeat-containing protein [Desulfobacterales bacterium]|nr:VCBS repeat-containing protein [Desulfobacterales bacterium]